MICLNLRRLKICIAPAIRKRINLQNVRILFHRLPPNNPRLGDPSPWPLQSGDTGIFKIEDQIAEKRDALIDRLQKRMSRKTNITSLFTIQWESGLATEITEEKICRMN